MARERLQMTETRLGLTKGADVGSALAEADMARPRADKRGRRGDRPKRRDMADVSCYQCTQIGHYRRDCTKRANGGLPGGGGAGAANLVMIALVTDVTTALGTWSMDNGASHLMIGEAGLLTDAKQ